MINISDWMKIFSDKLDQTFGGRIFFIGLQGSYARGEATETSDIDVVVILDELTPSDIRAYGEMLDGLENRELICGFLSGKNELLGWEPSDLFQFFHDTKPIRGTLDALIPLLDAEAVSRAVKIGACNIYHGCVHNMLHEKSEEILRGLYKSASFAVQAIVFEQTGLYFSSQRELLTAASPDDAVIIENFLHLKNGGAADFEKMSATLFDWAKKLIAQT
ncbi:MAG: nucleotidyltransferase domain-containing protein [Clostridia bacterium]|nr:nucleotidyltransferase domain-containing protein [Clostridia bacterium]